MAALVRMVFDRADTLRATRLVARAARPGVAVCRAAPEADPAQLARDVLRAVGKRFDVSDSPRRADHLWPRAAVWLSAEEIHELVVIRAHLLPAGSVAALCAAAHGAMHLSLFLHGIAMPEAISGALTTMEEPIVRVTDLDATEVPSPLRQGLIQGGVSTVAMRDLDCFASAIRPTPKPRETLPTRPLPPLPRDDFPFFLEACDRTLSPEDSKRADRIVAEARRTTDRWLEGHVSWGTPEPRRPSRERILAFLRSLSDCEDSEEALARMRGAQIALFFDDLLVEIDAPAFVAAHRAGRREISRLDHHAIALLRTHSSPAIASAGVLALCAGAGSRLLATLNIGDFTPDGSEARVDGRVVSVPEPARSMLRAQLRSRHLEEARPEDAFFMSRARPGHRAAASALRKVVERLGAQTGLAMPRPGSATEPWWDGPSQALRVHAL